MFLDPILLQVHQSGKWRKCLCIKEWEYGIFCVVFICMPWYITYVYLFWISPSQLMVCWWKGHTRQNCLKSWLIVINLYLHQSQHWIMRRFYIWICKLTCNDAENSISNPSCFLILSHLSSQLGNLEYFVPRMSCRNEAIRPGI